MALNKKDIQNKYEYSLTVGRLKEFIKNNPELPDNTNVIVQRIEDYYFEDGGWEVYLQEGDSYLNAKNINQEMEAEIARRKKGEEKEYPGIKNPTDYITPLTDELKEQFIPASCITKNEEDLVLIYLHE